MLKSHLYHRLPPIYLLSVLLSACTLNKPVSTNSTTHASRWQQHRQQLNALTHYQAQGAFAYISAKQTLYANFNWRQTATDNYRLLLINPLGNIELQLDVVKQQAQLTNRRGERFTGPDAQQLISQLAGMDIPLNDLRQWLLGLPGGASAVQLNPQQRLYRAQYRHHGQPWQVTIDAYSEKQMPPLPAKIELNTDNTRIKLRIDNWIVS